jgi:hypothetical protein
MASDVGGVEIHWGDGAVTTSTSTELVYYTHIYTTSGNYTIRIIKKKGTISSFGVKNSLNTYQDVKEINIGSSITSLCVEAFRYTSLQKVSLPNSLISADRVFFNDYFAFHTWGIVHLNIPRTLNKGNQICEGMLALKTVSIPNNFITNNYMFPKMSMLQHIHIPSNCNIVGIHYATSLRSVSSSIKNTSVSTEGNVCVVNNILSTGGNSAYIPKGVENIANQAFLNKEQLREIDIPDSVTTIGDGAFSYCKGLKRLTISANVSVLERDAFGRLVSMTSPIVIPPAVISIKDYCFTGTTNVACFDFSRHETIPTLSSTNAFTNTGSWKIVVPDNLYDEWIAATNWSTHASRIVKASEYVEPTTE